MALIFCDNVLKLNPDNFSALHFRIKANLGLEPAAIEDAEKDLFLLKALKLNEKENLLIKEIEEILNKKKISKETKESIFGNSADNTFDKIYDEHEFNQQVPELFEKKQNNVIRNLIEQIENKGILKKINFILKEKAQESKDLINQTNAKVHEKIEDLKKLKEKISKRNIFLF